VNKVCGRTIQNQGEQPPGQHDGAAVVDDVLSRKCLDHETRDAKTRAIHDNVGARGMDENETSRIREGSAREGEHGCRGFRS